MDKNRVNEFGQVFGSEEKPKKSKKSKRASKTAATTEASSSSTAATEVAFAKDEDEKKND